VGNRDWYMHPPYQHALDTLLPTSFPAPVSVCFGVPDTTIQVVGQTNTEPSAIS
jgi:hypothetical protein